MDFQLSYQELLSLTNGRTHKYWRSRAHEVTAGSPDRRQACAGSWRRPVADASREPGTNSECRAVRQFAVSAVCAAVYRRIPSVRTEAECKCNPVRHSGRDRRHSPVERGVSRKPRRFPQQRAAVAPAGSN
jgi:hypothetical protein